MAFNLGITLGNGLLAGSPPQAPAAGPDQAFATIPLPNGNVALYALSIRDFTPPYTALYGYIFPLSPTAVNKSFTAVTNIYDTLGAANVNGVQRTSNVFGNALPIFTIEGTTGWKYHSTDGYAFTGIQSIMAVQSLLNQFASLNRGQQLSNQPLYPLEYYDYYGQEFWTVVPLGEQTVRITSARPLIYEYVFRLAAIGGPVGQVDNQTVLTTASENNPLLGLLGLVNAGSAISAMNGVLNTTLSNYGI